ncbi:sigma-70 family RNA polymerase sigma factor [Paenibacillus nanensis]|uniref:Sigma-70 family RNA polymerase sigma factor n=1 Tax=Paenibacillus nanensis TaxID=393251 RepID=A0A3A1UV21_9BACL|nr:sigma-70 family RNA polymerase sigma factor [Paenibacillus nanensis]RIX52114.1 sigma-70 family RNA polymerase sigma factor [Paenibacillus nanensis]
MTDDRHQPDDRLVLDAQNGDFEAFRMIVLRYSNALLSVAYSVLGDFHEAQDAAQEAFVKGYTSLHTLKDPARLGSWLYAIAYRTSLDMAKRKKPALPFNETLHQETDNVQFWLDQHVVQDSLRRALQSLEETSKTAVVLYYLSDWPMKEISRFLNLSVSAVESRIRRARDMLRLHLAGDFEAYFRPYRLGQAFERKVSEQVLKRMGHFYLPVTDKRQTTDWFTTHFQLRRSPHGHLLLESGHELYLLECSAHSPKPIPLLTFSVSGLDALWHRLKSGGVRTEPIEKDDLFGRLFAFYDPDFNKYYAVEPQ